MKNERRQNSEVVLENKKVMIVVVVVGGEAAVMGKADFLFLLPSDCSRKRIMRSADQLCWKAKILFFFLKLLQRRRRGKGTTRRLKVSFKSSGPFAATHPNYSSSTALTERPDSVVVRFP